MVAAQRVKRPFGVLVLALVQVLSGIQLLGGALWALAVAAYASTPEGQDALESAISPWVADNAGWILALLGVGLLVLAVFSLLLARGYIKGREAARVRGRKVALFAILFALIGMVLVPNRADPGAPIWTILFNIIIYIYLNREKVKRYFRSGK